MKPSRCSIAVIERVIGIPCSDWHGNCFAIASQMVESGLILGTAVYGHYLGPVSPIGYWRQYAERPFIQHGWIALTDPLSNYRIMDPTRWSFEHAKPFVTLLLPTDEAFNDYDEGGNMWRAATQRPCPKPTFGEKLIKLELSAQARQLVQALIPASSPIALPASQLFWLANVPYDALAPLSAEIFMAISRAGLRATVPIDNMRRAEREYAK